MASSILNYQAPKLKHNGLLFVTWHIIQTLFSCLSGRFFAIISCIVDLMPSVKHLVMQDKFQFDLFQGYRQMVTQTVKKTIH